MCGTVAGGGLHSRSVSRQPSAVSRERRRARQRRGQQAAAWPMSYRGPLQDEVNADVEGEATIRLSEAAGIAAHVRRPDDVNASEWTAALARAADGMGQNARSATVADAGAVRAALAGSTPVSGAVQLVATAVPMDVASVGRLPSAVIVEATGAALQYGTPYENVEMDAFIRTEKKRSRSEQLKTKWFCGYCRHYTLRTLSRCGNCQTAKADAAGHDEAARKRLKAREGTKKGRQQNRAWLRGMTISSPRSRYCRRYV